MGWLATYLHAALAVAHQATGQHLGIEALHGLSDRGQQSLAVDIVFKDWLPPVTTGGDVIDGTGEFDA
jgi:hypothetical protein